MTPLRIWIPGDPRTKKNSQQIRRRGDRHWIAPSDAYRQYAADCVLQIPSIARLHIDKPVNVQCVYHMATRRKVDLVNLLEATLDILVEAGVLADDNSRIVASHDGSRVQYDRERPGVEIIITEG
ncbi:MAG TPA: RusA family crossover junction endodeoxyribonuclease [Candidatus Faecivicinus avistercoris]|nr:RusA family crossover junction endodeoxyribonuclease [Candidatus Faecivicinus avistercoris]